MFTSSDRTTDGDAFVIGSPGFGDEHDLRQDAYQDPLDDVFGSAPASPVRSHDEGDASGRHGTAEPSDVPRLRSIHVTNGYREGIAAGKIRSIQAGFDEGYALGAEYGHIAGRITGILEALSSTAVDRAEAEDLLQLARSELSITNLFGTEYFEQDGIWTYDVSEQSEDAPFRAIASAHPLFIKWHKITRDLAEKCGITL